MRPLAEMPLDPPIQGLLFDIDDTFTTEGLMTAEAFSALEQWHASGRIAVAVTGRPAGWCDHFARMWPVDAVVGENGAFSFSFDRASRRMRRQFVRSEAERVKSREAFDAISRAVLTAVPGAQVASDQAYRISDLAIDFAEDCGPLSLDQAKQIAAIMRASGMMVKVSSIHVNGWFGDFDKLSTTRLLASDQFGLSAEALSKAFVYIGDSPNDGPMFSFFERSIGVANVASYEGLMDHWPRYICQQPSASGFAEALQHILHKGA